MKKFKSHWKLYISIDIVILCFGYIFIQIGYSLSSKHNTFSMICLSIGTSLIAAGIVAILELWRGFRQSKVMSEVNSVIFDAGVKNIYNKRDLDKYDKLMERLNESLDIVGYSLSSFYGSYADLIEKKILNAHALKVRILFIDPDSIFSKNREELEGNKKGTFKNDVEKLVKKFSKYQSNIEIRKINSSLTSMVFRIDNVMFVGPHFYKKESKSTHVFELSRDGWLFEEYQREFDKLWDESEACEKND